MGTIKLKVFLSGMPELRLGLNDRVLFELTGRKLLEEGKREGEDPILSGDPEKCSQFSNKHSSALCWSWLVLRCWLIGANSASLLDVWLKYKAEKDKSLSLWS